MCYLLTNWISKNKRAIRISSFLLSIYSKFIINTFKIFFFLIYDHSAQRVAFNAFKPKSLDSLSIKSSHPSLEFAGSLLSTGSGNTGSSSSNPLSLSGELNLTSLSSDSGVHTGKPSEMSSSGDADIVEHQSASNSPKHQVTDKLAAMNDEEPTASVIVDETTSDDAATGPPTGSGLTRKNSVKARASMFQALEERMLKQPQKTEDKPTRKCIYYIRYIEGFRINLYFFCSNESLFNTAGYPKGS